MSALLNVAPNPVDAPIAEESWREELHRYFLSRKEGSYWAFDFDKDWAKFQRGLQQEARLVDLVGRQIDWRGARVLVIGSYIGLEAIAYAQRGARVVGIDLDEQALNLSRKLAHQQGVELELHVGDATAAPFADASFDYVSCSQVLEHLPADRQPRMLAEIWRLCKPGGLFWLDTPNQLAIKDHHDTGLPFIHWLPRRLKVPLARWLGRSVPDREPAFGNQPVYLHHYIGYFWLMRRLAKLGPHEVLSRYRGYMDIDQYCAARYWQGRAHGPVFALKAALLRALLPIWNWNWFSGIRLLIRKLPA